MKDKEPLALEPTWRADQVTSVSAGGHYEISIGGIPVLGFDSKDKVHRDIVIATLLKAEIPGKHAAKLCGVAESHVTRVRQKYEEGGMKALMTRPRHGAAPRPITAKQKNRVIELRREGTAIDAIARATKVPVDRVGEILDAVGMGSRGRGTRFKPVQLELGSSTADGESSAAPERSSERRVIRGRPTPTRDGSLRPGEPIVASSKQHRSRYAGVGLLIAQMQCLGVTDALIAARAIRGPMAVYSETAIALTMSAAFVSGLPSIEAMHERDAHSLGLLLGFERCPSVRTLHRALPQMLRSFDSVAFGSELMRHLRESRPEQQRVFGIDGHFKPYTGPAPVDKGWNSKKRLAQKGLQDVVIADDEGRTWLRHPVPAGDGLAAHLPEMARRIRAALGDDEPFLVAFDRGGFDFDILAALDAANVHYVAWIPASVTLPALASIAPASDGVGEAPFVHPRVAHASRLLVQRDDDALIPACTNLPTATDPSAAIATLRRARGMQENAFKAARRRVHIDRLSDRGFERIEPDTRLCDNPAHLEIKQKLDAVDLLIEQIESCPERCVQNGKWTGEYVFADIWQKTLRKNLRAIPARVERRALDPSAMRAFLRTRRRDLVLPLKYAADNAFRDLVHQLGTALSTTEAEHDATTRARTLLALLQSPGTLRFADDEVLVTLEFPLPPKPHQRLADALIALDERGMRFSDGVRRVRFRLAERPTRRSVRHGAEPLNRNSKSATAKSRLGKT